MACLQHAMKQATWFSNARLKETISESVDVLLRQCQCSANTMQHNARCLKESLSSSISDCLLRFRLVPSSPASYPVATRVRCFILDKRQLLHHITHITLSAEITESNPDTVSLRPWYLMTFPSVQEDRRNPSEWAFGNVCFLSIWTGPVVPQEKHICRTKANTKILVVMTTTPCLS